MKEANDHVHLEIHLEGDRPEAPVASIQGARQAATRELPHGGRRDRACTDAFRADRRRQRGLRCSRILPTCSNGPLRTEPRSGRSSARTPWSSPRRSSRTTREGRWISRSERERLISAIERAEAGRGGRSADDAAADPGVCDPRAGPGEVVQEAGRAARRGLRRGARQHLRPARLERGGQDHGREDPVHAAQGRRGDCQRQRLRCRHAGCGRAGVHQPHRTVRGRRRDPQRAGEPRARRPVAAPQGPGRDRG